MSPSSQHGGRRGPYLAAAATAVLAVTGVGFVAAGLPWEGPSRSSSAAMKAPSRSAAASSAGSQSPTPPAPAGAPRPSAPGGATPNEFGPVLTASTPVSLDIPSIKVHSTHLVDLGYTDQGELEVPADADLPGWFSPGPTPGQFGPAVIAGHVDSTRRPAVFFRLRQLKPGATVKVGREDGTTATFTVDKVEQYPKNRFPTSRVYGNTTNRAELRLITCGGSFDRDTGHYRDNVVAYAHLTP